MDVCDGGYDSHEYVAYSNSIRCPVCELKAELTERIDEKKQEIDSLTEELTEARKERDELSEQLVEYDVIKAKLAGMVDGRL